MKIKDIIYLFLFALVIYLIWQANQQIQALQSQIKKPTTPTVPAGNEAIDYSFYYKLNTV